MTVGLLCHLDYDLGENHSSKLVCAPEYKSFYYKADGVFDRDSYKSGSPVLAKAKSANGGVLGTGGA